MIPPALLRSLADAVLVLHVGVVLFVVGGLPLVLVGHRIGWRWVHALRFRLAHFATIAFVAAEAGFGVVCPLTTWEIWLRSQAREATHDQGFVEHWLPSLLFWQAPPWVFTAAYTGFALAVAAAWWYCPPRRSRPQP